jgi:hypothetical protein
MGVDSTADLLFRISADSAPAQADLQQLREAVFASTADASAQMESMGTRTASSARESREAIRGLGEEIGVHMPRFVSSWISSLGPVSGIMSSAFSTIAVIGLVEVLAKLPGTLQKGIDYLQGWDEAAKKAFEHSIQYASAYEQKQIELHERLRAIELIGKEGADKYHVASLINSKDIDEIAAKIAELHARETELIKVIQWKPTPPPVSPTMGTEYGMIGAAPQVNPHTHADIEKAEAEVGEIEKTIDLLTEKLNELRVKSLEIHAEAASAGAKETKNKVAKVTEDFRGLSEVLEQVKSRLAAATSPEAQMAQELDHLRNSAEAAKEKLDALNSKSGPKDAAGTADYARELAAWQQLQALIPQLQQQLHEKLDAQRSAEIARDMEAENKRATAELTRGLEQKARADQEAQAKAQREETAYQGETARLGEARERIEGVYQTSEQRIAGQYAADVARFNAAEEQKSLSVGRNEVQQAALRAQFDSIRAALLTKEQVELQALHNSQGWQGIFGNEFAQSIRRNEALTAEWAARTSQSHMQVRVALESLKEMAQDTFAQMAAGEAGAITHALIYAKASKASMEEVAKATLASLAEQAAVKAIFSLADGYADLAVFNYVGASAAFTAAELYGSVAAAATIAGRVIPSAQGGGGASAAGGGSDRSSSGSGGSRGSGGAMGTAANMGGNHLTVNVQGHLVGWTNIGELTGALNDAVLNGGHTLTATNTTSGTQVIK